MCPSETGMAVFAEIEDIPKWYRQMVFCIHGPSAIFLRQKRSSVPCRTRPSELLSIFDIASCYGVEIYENVLPRLSVAMASAAGKAVAPTPPEYQISPVPPDITVGSVSQKICALPRL